MKIPQKMASDSGIPTVDVACFFLKGEVEAKRAVIELISRACSEYGFFQVVNHGVPVELMRRALALSRVFFDCPTEEKSRFGPIQGAPMPAGYARQPENSADKNEFFLMLPPGSSFNVYPTNPPNFREVVDEMFEHFVKVGRIIESIINESLDLPPNHLADYNNDRKWDLMSAFRYFPSTEAENTGVAPHKDVNFITFVFEDNVGGLEVQKDGEWIPVSPREGTLVVNVGDIVQVLTNDRYVSANHRVVRQARERHSYAFFYNVGGDKWVEPMPQFTKDAGEAPKYKGFVYKEYLQLRLRNKTNPPLRPEDVISINQYKLL